MLQREWADFIGLSGFLSNPSIIGVYLRQLNAHSTLKKRALDDMRIVRKQVFMFLFLFFIFLKKTSKLKIQENTCINFHS